MFLIPLAEETVLPLCWRLIVRRCMGFFLVSLFCWCLSVFLCQCHTLSITVALSHFLKSERVMPPPVFFSFRIAFAVVGLLWFHINLRIICSSSVENVLDSLIGITSKSVDCFGYYGFFFFSLYATSKAYGSSQTRDWLQPSAAIHTAAVAAPDPLIHCARQGSVCASAITLVAVVGFFTHCSLVGTLSMAISRLSTLSIQKQNIFPFFESLSIPFINVLWFSAYNSFTFLVRYIPKYFMFFNAIFKGIFFKLSLSDLLLLMWRNAVDFFMLVLHPATLLNSLFSSSGFYVQSVGFTISLSLSL